MTLVPRPDRDPGTWAETLDALEADVARAEAVARASRTPLTPPLSSWVPPVHLGPLPEDLRIRAAHILQRQLAVAEGLVEQITTSKRQRDIAARMSQTPDRPAAAFIDQAL